MTALFDLVFGVILGILVIPGVIDLVFGAINDFIPVV